MPVRIEEKQREPEVTYRVNSPAKKSIREPNKPKNSNNSEINSINSEPPNNSTVPEVPKSNSIIPEFERIGRVGRQRRYEERKNSINSVRDIVLYRHIKGKHYPGLSADMRRWYEFFYFTQPLAGEKPFNANTSYEQHVESYERGQEWIARREADRIGPVGHSGPIDLQARRAIR